MKQHITLAQLNEMSEKQKEKFREKFWKIYEGDVLVYGDYKGNLGKDMILFKNGMIPADEENFGYKLLSIGQMIEFLTPSYVSLMYDGTVMDENLCDDLWEAVGKVLKKN